MKRLRNHVLGLAALAVAGAACDTSTAVFVAPRIEAPTLTVGEELLGTSLKGSFDLVLELASRASGPSEVTIGAFALRNADGSQVLYQPLPFTAEPAAPIDVAEDSEVHVKITIDTATEDLLPKSLRDALCAGQVTIGGTIQDSLDPSGATPVTSAAFTLGGC